MELTLAELMEMKSALSTIFNSKTSFRFAFSLLDLINEYDVILKKIEIMHNKLVVESQASQEEFATFLQTPVAFQHYIKLADLEAESISISPIELWTLKKIMVT